MRDTSWRSSWCAGACCESKVTSTTRPGGQRCCFIAPATKRSIAWPRSCRRPNEQPPFSSSCQNYCRHMGKHRLQRKATGMSQPNKLTQRRRGAKNKCLGAFAPLREIFFVLLSTVVLTQISGCRSHGWLRRSGGDPPPIAFSALPSPTEAVSAVNANTARIQSLQTQGATISIPGAPSIGAEIAAERPRRLRLRAKTQLLGPELDLGSN